MPQASFNLMKDEHKKYCEWLKGVKFPDGYAFNISRCVNVKEGKIMDMKSHDSHVLLQRLLPAMIHRLLGNKVCTALTELNLFFRDLCSQIIRLDVVD